jgi:hypothetical protein
MSLTTVRRFAVIYSYARSAWIVWDGRLKSPVMHEDRPRAVQTFNSGTDAAHWLKDRPELDVEEISETEAGRDPWRRKQSDEPRRHQ